MKFIRYIFGVILTMVVMSLSAQQLPQYTQFTLSRYVINPAYAGSENHFQGQSNYRSQWEGIKDAPRTYVLSVNGPIANQKMGIGGYVFVDITGPTQRNGFSLSYAYHLNITDELKLSLAINAGLLQYTIDGTEILFQDQSDAVFSNTQENSLYPDAGFSFYLYDENFFFGASAPQLIQNQLDFENSIKNPTGRLVSHYFITSGYNFDLNPDFDLEPSMLLKYVDPLPLQYEFVLRGIYMDKYWLGGSYRRGSAIGLLAGFTLQDNIAFGYSYDILQSDIQNYSTGSHEIMLSVSFNKKSR